MSLEKSLLEQELAELKKQLHDLPPQEELQTQLLQSVINIKQRKLAEMK